MFLKNKLGLIISALSTIILVACGGGGNSNPPSAYPIPAPTPAPTPAPLTASLLSVTIDGTAYDVIQMSGINASATPGGNAIADLRTVYAYTPDGTNGEGTYQGSSWPYATTDRDISELVVDFVATGDEVATFTKNSDNQILINDQPAYQYTGDNSDSAATGLSLIHI